MTQKYYGYSQDTDFNQREGACSKDIWRIYRMLPECTNFTLSFCYVGGYDEKESINFMKCGNPLDPVSVEGYEDLMKAAFRKYGYSGYKHVQLSWTRGFGNSVEITVAVIPPKMKGASE